MNTIDMKKEVLAMALQSFREKLFAGTSGNLSVYDPEKYCCNHSERDSL